MRQTYLTLTKFVSPLIYEILIFSFIDMFVTSLTTSHRRKNNLRSLISSAQLIIDCLQLARDSLNRYKVRVTYLTLTKFVSPLNYQILIFSFIDMFVTSLTTSPRRKNNLRSLISSAQLIKDCLQLALVYSHIVYAKCVYRHT